MVSYKELFQRGWVPEELDLEGKYAVYMVGPFLPKIRFFRHFKVFEKGKGEITGVNEFLWKIRVARFRVEKGKSLGDPNLDVIRIVYDDPSNPFIVRPLVDEIRKIDEDKYLGQGMIRLGGKAFWAFWFLVQRL